MLPVTPFGALSTWPRDEPWAGPRSTSFGRIQSARWVEMWFTRSITGSVSSMTTIAGWIDPKSFVIAVQMRVLRRRRPAGGRDRCDRVVARATGRDRRASPDVACRTGGAGDDADRWRRPARRWGDRRVVEQRGEQRRVHDDQVVDQSGGGVVVGLERGVEHGDGRAHEHYRRRVRGAGVEAGVGGWPVPPRCRRRTRGSRCRRPLVAVGRRGSPRARLVLRGWSGPRRRRSRGTSATAGSTRATCRPDRRRLRRRRATVWPSAARARRRPRACWGSSGTRRAR